MLEYISAITIPVVIILVSNSVSFILGSVVGSRFSLLGFNAGQQKFQEVMVESIDPEARRNARKAIRKEGLMNA